MTRDEVLQDCLKIKNKSCVLMLPTGFGKSKLAIDLLKAHSAKNILIVVPRIVLIQNWEDELAKWGMQGTVSFITYMSLHKACSHYDCVVFDEAQHLSPRCREIVKSMSFDRAILLSATLSRDMRYELKNTFNDLYIYGISMRHAIEEAILPDPRVFLVPLSLDSRSPIESIIKHKNAKKEMTCYYKDRWTYIKDRNLKVIIKCTQKEKNDELSSEIEYWKNKYMRTKDESFKNRWLFLAGQRLKWLSGIKNPYVSSILRDLKNQRTLVFCGSIEQTKVLGKNCINSKNHDSAKLLDEFNMGLIDHITACDILTEGVNLTNCRIGIYAYLNSSEIKIKQKLGRLLRHRDPVIIIPYFKGTREEEIMKKMLEDYNPDLIKIYNYENKH